MKIGILSDIHEHLDFLRAALARFRREGVDRVVVLGDVYETGQRIEETVGLLAEAGAVGVWGNHDIGLCRDPSDLVRARFPGSVLEFLATLQPRLEVDDLLFTHVEPWLDPGNITDLWYFGGPPDTPEQVARSFDAAAQRLLLVGHHHRWMAYTRAGRLAWDCFTPLRLDPGERYLIVVGPVCDGRCGILDTGANVLTPIDLRDGEP